MVQLRLPISKNPFVRKGRGRIISVHPDKHFVYCLAESKIVCVFIGWEYRDKISDGGSVSFFLNDDGDYEFLPE